MSAAHEQRHDGFLGMQTIFRFVENNAVTAVDHFCRYFFAAMCRQAMQENAVFVSHFQTIGIDLIARKRLFAFFGFALLSILAQTSV